MLFNLESYSSSSSSAGWLCSPLVPGSSPLLTVGTAGGGMSVFSCFITGESDLSPAGNNGADSIPCCKINIMN